MNGAAFEMCEIRGIGEVGGHTEFAMYSRSH
jgi:hypothetical protein